MAEKTCPICKNNFDCSHDEHCWCMSIDICEETRNELSKHFTDCLCKSCLTEFDEMQKKNLAK